MTGHRASFTIFSASYPVVGGVGVTLLAIAAAFVIAIPEARLVTALGILGGILVAAILVLHRRAHPDMHTHLTSIVVAVCLAGAVVGASSVQPPRRGAPQPTGTARISGTVVTAETGMPVRGAAVRLTSPMPGGGAWTTTTDANGRFEFVDLPAGRFSVTATKAGFVAMSARQTAAGDPVPLIDLRDGQHYTDGHIRLPRGGVIAGRVTDEYGEPVVEAEVRVFRTQYVQGTQRLMAVRGVHTNDLGQYRLYGLQPGKYFVSGNMRVGGFPIQMSEPEVHVMRGGGGFAPTFFPGTVSAADAQPVSVVAGNDTAGVDFALQSVRMARIAGTVVDSRGRPAPDYLVMLNGARTDRALMTNTNIAEAGADGRFVLSNITPGEYRLDVRAKAEIEAIAKSGGGVGQPQSADAAEFASVPFTVTGEDVDNLRIPTTRGYLMTGRITVEGTALPAELLPRLRISALEAGAGISAVMAAAAAPVQADGTFELRGLFGTRIVRLGGLPAGWMLKTIRVGGADVTDDGLEIVRNVDDAEIVVTSRVTAVKGIARNSDGTPAAARTIVIFPDDRRRRQAALNRFMTTAKTASDGAFSMEAIPPADYLAAIVDRLVDGEWAESDNLERLARTATRFSLAEGETKSLNLTTLTTRSR